MSTEQPTGTSTDFWRATGPVEAPVLELSGAWTMATVQAIRLSFSEPIRHSGTVTIKGADVTAFDTTGAMLLQQLVSTPDRAKPKLTFVGFAPRFQRIVELVMDRLAPRPWAEEVPGRPLVEELGRSSAALGRQLHLFISFLGEALAALTRTALMPATLRARELVVQLERTCVFAVPIVALVTFLIGVVVAYLSATQLEKYGASIFLVDGVGLAMCRELSPVLVAIIVAGRSGSAFTAQIGAMKINEEIDALQALGLTPMQVLVIPRLLALVIAMPLLTFVGDVVGVLGGMVIGEHYLNISPVTFFERLQLVLLPKHVYVGLAKAPIFAIIIALIGCRMGLAVENTATSVGINTTSTVVQSIVAVILLDAAFAVVCSELGI